MVTCSPVDTTTSYSLPMGNSFVWFARSTSLLVSPDMADTTTITLWPFFFVCATLMATFLILSTLPTDVPPYFWTINAITYLTLLNYFPNQTFNLHHQTQDLSQAYNISVSQFTLKEATFFSLSYESPSHAHLRMLPAQSPAKLGGHELSLLYASAFRRPLPLSPPRLSDPLHGLPLLLRQEPCLCLPR